MSGDEKYSALSSGLEISFQLGKSEHLRAKMSLPDPLLISQKSISVVTIKGFVFTIQQAVRPSW